MSENEHRPIKSDGLSDFNLEQIGRKAGTFGGARLLKFVDGRFVTREGGEISGGKELLALELKKIIQKFVGRKLMETTVIPDGEKVPDLEAMNDAAPREEWGTDFNGKPVGPYVLVLLLKLIDIVTLDRFAFVTNTTGGSIAVGDLSDKVKIMRELRGLNVSPVVALSVTTFKSANFGPRKRPDFRPVRWLALSADVLPQPKAAPAIEHQKAVAAPPVAPATPPTPEPKPTPAPAAAQAPASVLGGQTMTLGEEVDEPTLREERKDDLPF
jgi:hypothetical protein